MDRTEEYKSYINLANKTLEFLYHADETVKSKYDIQEVSRALCAFQELWSKPMELPFGVGYDMQKPIKIQRPAEEILLSLGCAIRENEQVIVYGTNKWKRLKGDTPNASLFWIVRLIELLGDVYKADETKREQARALISCWYYHASEIDFSGNTEPELGASGTGVDLTRKRHAEIKAETVINSILFGANIQEGEEDEEEDEEEEDEMDISEEEEEDEEEEEEPVDISTLSEEQIKQLEEQANQYKLEGNKQFSTGDWEGAIESYTKAIQSSPKNTNDKAVFYGNRAACFVKIHHYPAVVRDCTRALAINEKYEKVLIRRAQAYEELEQLEEAFNDYQRVLQLNPNEPEARRCSVLLQAVLTDDGSKCINSTMIETALTNMISKASKRREQAEAASELMFEESAESVEAKKNILLVVESTGAFLPPQSQPLYHQRMLEKIRAESTSGWFPWGLNPPNQQ